MSVASRLRLAAVGLILLRWTARLALIIATAPAVAGFCPTAATTAEDLRANWPRYDVYFVTVTPKDGRALAWPALHWPHKQELPRIPYDSSSAAFAGDLYAARAQAAALPLVMQHLTQRGDVQVIGPVHLKAPQGRAARYQLRQEQHLVTELHSPGARPGEPVVEKIPTFMAIETQTAPDSRVQVALSWQQVTGWLSQQDPAQELLKPLLLTAQAVTCVRLQPGDALIVGEMHSLHMDQDRKTQAHRETVMIVQAN